MRGKIGDDAIERSGSRTGSLRSRTAFSALKMTQLEPMPAASSSTTDKAKPGLRRKPRRA
jgi:hypothetical protein